MKWTMRITSKKRLSEGQGGYKEKMDETIALESVNFFQMKMRIEMWT